MIAALLASFWVLHAIAVVIVESFGSRERRMLQFAEAHMQVRAARNQVGWFKKQEHRVERELRLSKFKLKLYYLSRLSRLLDPDLFWQNEAKKCSNFKDPGSTMRG
jgi:hypothetical protein